MAEAHQLKAKRAVSALASVVFIAAYRGSFYMLNPAWWQGCSPLKGPPPGRVAPADIQRGEEVCLLSRLLLAY